MPDPVENRALILPRWVPVPLMVSLAALALVLYGSGQQLSPLYYLTMYGIGLALLGGTRWQGAQARLQAIALPGLPRLVLLGYLAVMAEEMLVGTLFAVNEGFTLPVWFERMGQFIAFNLLAFSGAIWGLWVVLRLFPGLVAWHFWLAGAWGLFAEGVYLRLLGNPIAAALIVVPNMVVYAIILAPAVLSLPVPQARPRLWQLPVALGLMFLISLPFVALLINLRRAYPGAFPICDYIAC